MANNRKKRVKRRIKESILRIKRIKSIKADYWWDKLYQSFLKNKKVSGSFKGIISGIQRSEIIFHCFLNLSL